MNSRTQNPGIRGQAERKQTPMLKQYLEIKAQYPDCILFYRMGDFYEMFFEDAVTASRILEITLTSRDKKSENPVPMCGIPFHAAEGYITRLVRQGRRVAICEQVEDPKTARGIVRREVVRIVTPGLITLDGGLDSRENNFLVSVAEGPSGKRAAAASLDISTGEFRVTTAEGWDTLLGELFRIQPRELLLPDYLAGTDLLARMEQALPQAYLSWRPANWFAVSRAEEVLKDHFQVLTMDGFGLGNMPEAVCAAGALIAYCRETQKRGVDHVGSIRPYNLERYLRIDEATVRNLELTSNSLDGGVQGTLLSILDRTVTAMGGRLLKKWMLYPLVGPEEINARLSCVGDLADEPDIREDLRSRLKDVYDMERLIGKVSMETANARDLLALKTSLAAIPGIRKLLSRLVSATGRDNPHFRGLLDGMDPLEDIFSLIDSSIREDCPAHMREGHIIKKGYNRELDELLELQENGRQYIAGIEADERQRTGITSLKVGYNRVFGYFLEVPKSQSGRVPENYIRKQTLVSAERYITPELKEMEAKILTAEEKRLQLELEIFRDVTRRISGHSARIQATASALSETDVFCALSHVAEINNYVRPDVSDRGSISIEGGRHPVVEKNLQDETFVPNDMELNHEDSLLVLITGPNMAGKSTILRQTALIVLMAQMGSFVPASKADIGIVDQIFTRVGATDYLSRGQSTFMVEMTETANILNNATPKSLVILDEIGRGTSTYDGLSIAWAVCEHLLFKDGPGIKTMFATHYHELTALEKRHNKVKNMHVEVKEHGNRIYFLHSLKEGATSKSYGIQVAALAGVPDEVIENARSILREIEEKNRGKKTAIPSAAIESSDYKVVVQKTLPLSVDNCDPIREKLLGLNINNTTPLEALNILDKLCKRARKEN